jgi:glutaminyl-peptide cyclotransferase
VRLPGRRPDRILFIGHYDTKILKGQRFVGASDGGSSAAFLIEFARTLAAKPQAQREFTYELVWLDGEEAICLGWYECGTAASPDNTYGSRYYVQAAEKAGALKSIRAVILVDMIIDRDLQFHRESDSTPWLKDIIWGTARSMAYERVFLDDEQAITDDHIPFLKAGIPAVDIIDLAYPYWHTPDDTLEHVSARGFQIVGDVLLAALPKIEDKLK